MRTPPTPVDEGGRRFGARQSAVPFGVVLGFSTFNACAQIIPDASGSVPDIPAITSTPAGATGKPAGKKFSIVTNLSVIETMTDNANLSSDKKSDLITQVTPSINIRSNTARLQGFFDYSLSALEYARGSESNSLQNILNAAFKAEAIENFAFIDASASVSRQNISAVGTQTPDSNLQTSNQTQVKTVNLSPYLRGRLASANYEVRLNYATSRTSDGSLGDSTTTGASAHLGSDPSNGRLGWAVDGYTQGQDYSQERRIETQSAVGTLLYSPINDTQVSLRGGREYNNVLTEDRQGNNTYGGGLTWKPSVRTTFSAQFDKHYYGDSHSVTFEHRTPQTVLTYVNSSGASTDPGAGGQIPVSTAFDLLMLQLASQYPDPILRAQQANIQLQALGINPNSPVPGGFLTSSVSLYKTQSLSLGYVGSRTTVLLSAQTTQTSGLANQAIANDPLAAGNAVRTRGLSLGASHRLTPQSSLSLNVAKTKNTETISGGVADLLTVTVGYTEQLGARTVLALMGRKSVSTGDSSSYNESALIASLTLQF